MRNLEPPEKIVVKAIKVASKKANPGLEKLLEVHLHNVEGKGLEIAYEDPKKFKESVSKLFGEYSCRLLELLVIQEIKRELGIEEEINSLEDAVEIVRMMTI